MNIKRAKQEIKDSIEAYLTKDNYGEYKIPSIRQRPILLMGPPGIGKTQIMEQIARECEIGLVAYTITHHTRQSAIGLPFIREKEYSGQTYSVTEYTMSEIIASVYEKIEQTGNKEGILFIDEINCVSETLAPTMLQFLQCKMFGNQKVPDGWIIVAAGNPPEYNKSVRDFDVVTLDRMKKIDVEADYEVWKEYAYQAGIHPAILAYLEIRKEYFYRVETPIYAMNEGGSPILSYNYGARRPARVRKAMIVMSAMILCYTAVMWSVIIFAPGALIRVFSSNPSLVKDSVPALNQYFAAFIFMDLQYIGQTVFKSLNKKKHAIFFSLLRKVFIVIPLTYFMPYVLHMGTSGVFLAEPVSNVIGGGLCFVTMLCTVLPELRRMDNCD